MEWWLMVILYVVGAVLFGTLNYLMREDLHRSAESCGESAYARDHGYRGAAACTGGHGAGFVFLGYVLWPLVFPGSAMLWIFRGHLQDHLGGFKQEKRRHELERIQNELELTNAKKQLNAVKLDVAAQERLLSDGHWPQLPDRA